MLNETYRAMLGNKKDIIKKIKYAKHQERLPRDFNVRQTARRRYRL